MTGVDIKRFEELLDGLLEGGRRHSGAAVDELGSALPATPLPPGLVEKAINVAALLLAAGQSEQSCLILECLVRRGTDDPTLLNNLAFSHLVGGRLEQAIALWERAAELAPGDRLIARNLAQARSRRSA